MRTLVLDELRPADMPRVKVYLEEHATPSEVEGLYWMELDEDLLTDEQAGHERCRPHRFAAELGPDFLKLELLIRPADGLRCQCSGYATGKQRRAILAWADRLIADLNLST